MKFKKKRPKITKAVIRRLVGLFSKTKGLVLAYLFGSAGKGRGGLMSDVDIAVLFGKEPPPNQFTKFIGRIMEVLEFPAVDVVLLNKASPLLKYEVVKEGKLLYFKSEDRINEFEMGVLKRYFDTKWLRERQNQILREAYGV